MLELVRKKLRLVLFLNNYFESKNRQKIKKTVFDKNGYNF